MSVSIAEKLQMQIIYLFMNADGICNESETARFDIICKEMKATKEDIDDILNQAKKIKFADNSDNSELVIREIGILLGKTKEVGEYEWDIDYTKSVYAHLLNKNKVRQAHTVWTLINLGYADSVLAPSERKVIDYLVSVWEMNELLSSTLFDIAETILALQMKKEWVLSTNKSDDEKDKMCADIDEEMKKMYDDVELTISEANI